MKKSALILVILVFANACSVCDQTEKAISNDSARGRLIEQMDDSSQNKFNYMTRHGRHWKTGTNR